MNNPIDDIMKINEENKEYITNFLKGYKIKKYIIFDNSTVKYPEEDITYLLMYPDNAKYGMADDIKNKEKKIFVTQTADIVVDVNEDGSIKVMYVRSGLDKVNRDKEILELYNELKLERYKKEE